MVKKLYSLILVLVLFSGCDSLVKPVKIPSYIKIESYEFSSNYLTEGSASSNIKNVWVYVDDQLIGAFEIPAVIPVIGSGVKKVTVLPGISLNGIAETHDVYNLYSQSVDQVELFPDSTITIVPEFTYLPGLNFWTEDFEDPSIKFQADFNSPKSFSFIDTVSSDDVFEGRFSGFVELSEGDSYFRVVSNQITDLPPGKDVFLELNFMNTVRVMTGVVVGTSSGETYYPIVQLNPATEETKVWKKIYIELKENISAFPNAQYFKIFLESELESDQTEGEVYIDNVKVVYPN